MLIGTVGLGLAMLSPAWAQSTPLCANLIVNGDAEEGPAVPSSGTRLTLAGWSDVEGQMWISPYGEGVGGVSHNTPGPLDRGENFFWGGRVTRSTITQVRDVSDLAAMIDAGKLDFHLSGWFGGWQSQNDRASLTAVFLDGQNEIIAEVTAGPVTNVDRGNQIVLLFRAVRGEMLPGTRAIRFTLTAIRVATSNNDGYSDNLSMVLIPIVPPLPGDFDCDGDADTDDYAILASCLAGPDVPYNPQNLPPGCRLVADVEGIIPADLERVGHVDLAAYAVFQNCFSGADILVNATCTP